MEGENTYLQKYKQLYVLNCRLVDRFAKGIRSPELAESQELEQRIKIETIHILNEYIRQVSQRFIESIGSKIKEFSELKSESLKDLNTDWLDPAEILKSDDQIANIFRDQQWAEEQLIQNPVQNLIS